jgi:hypothetical protein
VSCRGYGKEFGRAFDDTEYDRYDIFIHRCTSI